MKVLFSRSAMHCAACAEDHLFIAFKAARRAFSAGNLPAFKKQAARYQIYSELYNHLQSGRGIH